MYGYIDGIDWVNAEPMKYWSFASGTSDEVKKSTVRNAVFSGDYLGALKVDGYYQRVCKDEDGNLFMIARSRNVKGEIVDKHEWLPHLNPWFESLPNGTCLLCECYWPGNEGSKNITSILGCLKEKAIARQANAPLHLYVFDVMAYAGVNYNNTSYTKRAQIVTSLTSRLPSPYVEWAEFYEGAELWAKLQDYLASGREGMVIMRKDAIVYNKRTPARVSIKVKRELRDTIDCFFTGRATAPTKEYSGKELATWQYWEDQRTGEKLNGTFDKDYYNGKSIVPVTKSYFYGFAGSLEIGVLKHKMDGNVMLPDGRVLDGYVIEPIGLLSGLTEEIKAAPKNFAFKPIEVTAMDFDSERCTLRHGKLVGFRDDLALTDCTFDKLQNQHHY